jgi:hypothetical protein
LFCHSDFRSALLKKSQFERNYFFVPRDLVFIGLRILTTQTR